MGLGQESDREGEVVSLEAASSAPGRVAMKCQEAPFAAIAQNLGREGLHIMTESMRLVHEGCGSGHFTVGGADNDLRKALTIARHGPPGVLSSAYTGASRAGVSLKTRDKCGLGQLRLATDGPEPGERQRRRGGVLAPQTTKLLRPFGPRSLMSTTGDGGSSMVPASAATSKSESGE